MPDITTALPSGVSTMEKVFEGDISGHSATLFTAAFDAARGVGTYIALEAFEGSLLDRHGTFNFVHAASTSGTDRTNEFFTIVPNSGTGALTSIHGTGGMTVDADGTHHIRFDFDC